VRLYLVASKPTDSVIHGFLPAAASLGLDVVLLTDQPAEHERARASARRRPRPGCLPHDEDHRAKKHRDQAAPVRVLECDVWDARQLIGAIARLPAPDAIFSNSDHLQTQTALAAEYFGVPGKDWRSALRAKNKSLMRRRLAETGTEHVAAAEIRPETKHPLAGLAYPVVLKPSEGVASEDVMLVGGPDELRERSAEIFARRPGETLLAEEYLPGGLRTMETLGDGVTTWVLGGFRTRLSPLPFFIEERLTWNTPVPEVASEHVLGALTKLGAGFGACHTEYVDTDRGPVLIEVNDRIIGDDCDFVLSDVLGVDVFELVLRVYLGERLPRGPAPEPSAGTAHSVIDYVVADRPGVLAASPPAGAQRSGELGVLLSYRPLREVGDHIPLTHTNRDYLGVITAIGADPAAVELSVAAMRTMGNWEITECAP
jgi:biotin carboxylase